VVLAYPKQIVAVPPAKTRLLFPTMIPSFINSLPMQSEKLNSAAFNWLSTELVKSHRPYIPKPICESYSIPFSDFQTGGRCGTCGKLGLIKIPRSWHCPHCGVNDNQAHFRNLEEWFLIFKRTITNRECREFLHVDSIHTATRILQNMDLKTVGSYKDRVYIKDFRALSNNKYEDFILG
jgi:rubredoxin